MADSYKRQGLSICQKRGNIHIDNKPINNIENSVYLNRKIDRALQKWGVSSDEDRRRLTVAIELAARKVTKRIPLPSVNEIILYEQKPYHSKLAGKDIIQFLRIVWGKWIEARVLTRCTLRKLDPSAERALRYWLKTHGNKLPPDIYIPTKKEINDELILSGEAIRSPRRAYLLASRHLRSSQLGS